MMAKVWTITVDGDGEPMRTTVWVTEEQAAIAYGAEVAAAWRDFCPDLPQPENAQDAYEALCNMPGFLDTICMVEHDISDHPELKGGEPLTEAEMKAIEDGGKRWQGEDHRVASVRWEPYKPDGQRQMKAKGRWQECQMSGDFHRWANCDRPTGARKGGDA
jgi:hypothetical protein